MTKCGGKGGNQAIEAARHGAATAIVSCIGNDDFGARLLDNLAASKVDVRFVERAETGSGMAVAISDAAGDYGAVIVTGSNARIGEAGIDAAIGEFSRNSILVLQNEIPERANLVAARGARSRGGRVIINAAPAREMSPELLELVDVLIVNAVEAEMLGSICLRGRRQPNNSLPRCRLSLSQPEAMVSRSTPPLEAPPSGLTQSTLSAPMGQGTPSWER
jgi:ribokinase